MILFTMVLLAGAFSGCAVPINISIIPVNSLCRGKYLCMCLAHNAQNSLIDHTLYVHMYMHILYIISTHPNAIHSHRHQAHNTHMHTHTYNTHAYAHTHTRTHTHAHTNTHAYTHAHKHTRTNTHTHTHAHTHTLTHMHTNTHTPYGQQLCQYLILLLSTH